jgi:hypothetical protein
MHEEIVVSTFTVTDSFSKEKPSAANELNSLS